MVRDAPVARDALRGDHHTATHPGIREFASKTRFDAMPVEITENRDVDREEAGRIETRAPGEGVSIDEKTKSAQAIPPPGRQSTRRRRLLMGVLGALLLVAAGVFGIPWIREILNTVSTDDAYVNGHVTFVAPRVSGQISRVLVDDNYRVRKGELLAQIDKEPFQIAVSQKQAAIDTANADLQAAIAGVRAIEAEARSRRWKLQSAEEDLENQIALLHDRVAALDKAKATFALAQADFDRAKQLLGTPAESRQQFDRYQEVFSTASAQVSQALAGVRQVRASLGLPPQPDRDEDLGRIPPDLDQTYSSVLEAQANLIQSAAELGVVHSFDQSPKQMLDEFEKQGAIDRVFAEIEKKAPAVQQAEAKLEVAKQGLAQAELDLRYCDIVAEIDGVVTRRNVNPGDYVQIGQNLMAIRSLRDIWVDANFKETQLADLRIGQAADLYVDMYGGRLVFKGRVSGFTMGTGSTLALLPAQNATGNFVKVVQRLPVRIDLEGYDPDKNPLFTGTSVVPYVYINKSATGPDAGKFLQTNSPQSQTTDVPQNPPGINK
jgi:membrane fusion protein, multidrug efflux system